MYFLHKGTLTGGKSYGSKLPHNRGLLASLGRVGCCVLTFSKRNMSASEPGSVRRAAERLAVINPDCVVLRSAGETLAVGQVDNAQSFLFLHHKAIDQSKNFGTLELKAFFAFELSEKQSPKSLILLLGASLPRLTLYCKWVELAGWQLMETVAFFILPCDTPARVLSAVKDAVIPTDLGKIALSRTTLSPLCVCPAYDKPECKATDPFSASLHSVSRGLTVVWRAPTHLRSSPALTFDPNVG